MTTTDDQPTLTEVVLAAIVEELRRRREVVDCLRDPSFVQITVRFSGMVPRQVEVRAEMARLTGARHRR